MTAALDRMRRDPLLAFASAAGPFSIVLLLFLMTDKPSGATAALAGAITFFVSLIASRLLIRETAPESAEVAA